jgi:light-regulated signal transduction histidine kinase (bacteriophytochrome)
VGFYLQRLDQRYRGKLDADADEFIGSASDGVTRMQRLINDLLDYSRAGSYGQPLVPIPLEEPLQRALRNLKTAIDEKKAQVTWAPLPMVLGDDGQLERVFQNLLANAIKFCNRDIPQVHVSAERQGAMWVLSVRDNGIGIEPQSVERLFKLFQRVHDRSQYSGSGIGLAVCKKIVERHGGRIWAESTPGQGSTFFFTLMPSPEPR